VYLPCRGVSALNEMIHYLKNIHKWLNTKDQLLIGENDQCITLEVMVIADL